jgi:uncharacterized protein (TIGR02001 family)
MKFSKMMAKCLLFTIIIVFVTKSWAQSPTLASSRDAGGQAPSYKLTGEAELLTHFVHHGLSQTNQDPSLHGSFWFNFGPQFRLGIWGSNTNFEGSDIHLWMRFSADVKVDFNENAQLFITYNQNQFYKSSARNGNTVGLDLGLFKYHIIYEIESNWDGTSTGSSYYAFQKNTDVFSTYKWNNQVGYSMVKATGYSNYFDLRTALGTKLKDVFVEISATGTSAASQFNGRGDYFVMASVQAGFN